MHRHPILLLTLALPSALFACREPNDDPGAGPVAVATADPGEGTVPLTVTLSGSDSAAGDAPIERYEWLLPDGSMLDGETVATTLVWAGTHGFTLTVLDEDGRDSEASIEVEAACPEFEEATVAGIMSWGEVSGLASASVEGVLWGHGDAQGAGAEVYAISTTAVLQGTFVLEGVQDYDWEDIARGPGPTGGVSWLYVGDTGDNAENRQSVTVLRFEEPTVFDGGTITAVERLELSYPDGARDSETLLVDPLTGDIVLVERDRDDLGESGIYLAQAPLDASVTTDLTRVGSLTFGVDPLPGDVDATGGDVSPDGTLVAVRTHDRVWLFARDPALPLHTAFANPVCSTPPVDEPKGEAVAFAWDGSGYFTGGEGDDEALHWFGAR